MQLWAAIDILEGSVVTLVQGRATERTVWREDPVKLAQRWQDEGAYGLHLVDLDAAFQKGSNKETILKILNKSGVPVELGGGIRTQELAAEWLRAGVERVVVGTVAYGEPATLSALLRAHGPERIVVATDYKDGRIVTMGWTQNRHMTLPEAVKYVEEKGGKTILMTCVGRDGTRAGPDVASIAQVCGSTDMDVLASGGIVDGEDLEEIERAGAKGAILGRALYEKTILMSEVRRRS